MLVVAKIGTVLVLTVIAWQDFKERQIWWFLVPLFAILGTYLFYTHSSSMQHYGTALLINAGLVLLILLVLYSYVRWVLRKNFLQEAFGLGDVLCLIAFAVSLPTLSFLYFLVSALFFSFLLNGILKLVLRNQPKSVPLAGTISLFLVFVYAAHWMGWLESLYFL
ncbi:MAG: hypothetical protein AAF489_08790 [Bacteroidota bacterium]